jgi:GNAT superfamily N-acetyltransferase
MRVIRRLVPGDVPLLLEHMLGLGQSDRRLRFCAAASDSVIRRYCASIDWGRSLLLGCFEGRRLIGVVHLLSGDLGRPDRLEMAISVERAQRGRGIGAALLARAMVAARSRGVTALSFVCLAEDEAMQRLALRAGGRLVTDGEHVDGTIAVWDWEASRLGPKSRPPDAERRAG